MQQMCEGCSEVLINIFNGGIEYEEKTLGGIWGPCVVCGAELNIHDGHRNYGDSHLLSTMKRMILHIRKAMEVGK